MSDFIDGRRPGRDKRALRVVCMLLGFLLEAVLCEGAVAQSANDSTGEKSPTDKADQRLAEMRERFRAITVYRGKNGRGKKLKPRTKPLFRFSDPARKSHDATLWAWGRQGRPKVLLGIERYPKFWSYELISLSIKPVSAVTPGGWTWSPEDPGVQFRPFPEAPSPAETAPARGLQMKTLVRWFRLTERLRDSEETYNLRLLPSPVLRYAQPESGLVDGSLFLFAVGTNPEAACLMEARQDAGGGPAWHFAFAPIAGSKLTSELDGETVWTKPPPPAGGRFQLPYTLYQLRDE